MKKQALLSLMTVGTIIATSAVSYAAWDKLDGTTASAVELSYNKPVVLNVGDFTSKAMTFGGGINDAAVPQETDIEVTATDLPTSGTNSVTLATVDENGDALVPTGVDVKYYKGATELASGVDTNVTGLDVGVTYTVKVTLKADADSKDISTFTKQFKVKATLSHTK